MECDFVDWPVLIFEVDGFFQRVDSIDKLAGLYEAEYWDEVSAAFDSQLRRVEVWNSENVPKLAIVSGPDPDLFKYWAKRGLARMWKVKRFRVQRATLEQERRIESLEAGELWDELIVRTGAID